VGDDIFYFSNRELQSKNWALSLTIVSGRKPQKSGYLTGRMPLIKFRLRCIPLFFRKTKLI